MGLEFEIFCPLLKVRSVRQLQEPACCRSPREKPTRLALFPARTATSAAATTAAATAAAAAPTTTTTNTTATATTTTTTATTTTAAIASLAVALFAVLQPLLTHSFLPVSVRVVDRRA